MLAITRTPFVKPNAATDYHRSDYGQSSSRNSRPASSIDARSTGSRRSCVLPSWRFDHTPPRASGGWGNDHGAGGLLRACP